tara:strand:+ start:148 stop:474 length:327 start_codon:yes stop_codon:yes gene_type:complete
MGIGPQNLGAMGVKSSTSPLNKVKGKGKGKGNSLLDKAAGVASFITNPVGTTVKALVNKTGAFKKPTKGTNNSTDFFGGPSSKAVSDYNKSVDKKNKKNGMSAKMTQH